MLLTLDIGNTSITLGVFRGEELKESWRLSTDARRTADEYGASLLALLSSSGIKAPDLKAAIVSSVVPQMNAALKDALARYLGLRATFVTHENCGIKVLTERPSEVGPDRLVNAVAAFSAHKKPLIVADFGTAVTFDYVTGKGEFAGGAIAPGIGILSEALHSKTAVLPRVEAVKPERLVGRNTIEAMRSGLFYGFLGLVDGILERMAEEAGTDPIVVATGGHAGLLKGESRRINEIDEFLTLKGLRIIHGGKID
ncbi:MAG: type III pantothenate kinase [Deltaproteobacteria bacterium]|nr:type III pantothenate kinase [Deltaproteobacteria bacterium]MBZ0220095.1 type III pantothenate kinase [Deltaproteobacteria bacterium]